jgi:hypothetical protein
MQDKPSGGGDEGAATTAQQDAYDQAMALREVLLIYPELLTLAELVRLRTVASTEFSDCDRVMRAVRDLTACGLIHRCGELVLPTRAAVHFDSLREL